MSSYFALGPRIRHWLRILSLRYWVLLKHRVNWQFKSVRISLTDREGIGISRSGQDLRELQQNQPLLDEIVSFEENDQDILEAES